MGYLKLGTLLATTLVHATTGTFTLLLDACARELMRGMFQLAERAVTEKWGRNVEQSASDISNFEMWF